MTTPGVRLGHVDWEKVDRLIALGALAYLGFFVFGWILGVFSFWQVPPLTIGAGLMILIAAFHAYRVRRALKNPDVGPEIERNMHKQRTERGF
jgi:hypothetical protein